MSSVTDWLQQVHEEKGSDLFVTVNAPPCIKVHGKIRAISTEVLLPEEVDEIVRSLMSDRQEREFDEVSVSAPSSSRGIPAWSAGASKPRSRHSMI
jgi:twitching motility protein PilU